jgi:uncharacterized membrane protein YesL
MPDALVMRTIFDVIDSPPKFNSNYKNKFLPKDAIGLELLLLASSLVCNQTYEFDTDGSQSADYLLQAWQDNCVAARMFFFLNVVSFFSYSKCPISRKKIRYYSVFSCLLNSLDSRSLCN